MPTTKKTTLAKLAQTIRREHKTASAHREAYQESARKCGEALIEAKAQLKHGEWKTWVEQNCHVTERTARHYMAFARGEVGTLHQGAQHQGDSKTAPGAVIGTEVEEVKKEAEIGKPVRLIVIHIEQEVSLLEHYHKDELAEDHNKNLRKRLRKVAARIGEIT